ncbi:MAG: bifunctional DNA-formamidopyrimidine glycosylase/DNA-(apurinic or apyrimidinic site) lyase [Chloroflexi bacterium]|nr:bifunctional DNA-formamidopyrimidine glycosylase/DNA-(apurinic or apyrimidinic site) lyase [Chloroflexota bacterium]
MPELPEVENIRRYLLRKRVAGRRVTGAEVRWPRLVKSPDLEGFVTGLIGRRIKGIDRHGKYLLVSLDRGIWGLHMGMTGSVRVASPEEAPERFVHATFRLDDGRRIDVNDPRKWSSLWLVDREEEIVGELGPDALDAGFSVNDFILRLGERRVAIKTALVDQSVLAGVGNIYADEALFRAGIRPTRPANRISNARLRLLYRAVRDTLVHATGYIGDHPLDDGRPFVVDAYDGRMDLPRQGGGPCPKCGTRLKVHAFGNRSSYFCPSCQH